MFQGKELKRLRVRKEQLAPRCELNRQQFLSDWRRLRSAELWLGEATSFGRRHPWWIVTLATLAGTAATKSLRCPRTIINKIGRLGKFASAAYSVWKIFRRRRV